MGQALDRAGDPGRQWLAVSGHDPAGQRGGGRDGDLLAQDGPDGELEPFPGARYAQARTRRHQRLQGLVLAELGADGQGIGRKIEDAPDPGDDGRQQ